MEKSAALEVLNKKMNENFTSSQKDSWERDAQGMPLLEGETYHMQTITEDTIHVGTIGAGSANAGDKYLQFETVEGTMLGIAQIARKGNGLGLEGAKRRDLVADFIAKVNTYCEENADAVGFPFTVKSLKTRPGQSGLMVIPTFTLPEA